MSDLLPYVTSKLRRNNNLTCWYNDENWFRLLINWLPDLNRRQADCIRRVRNNLYGNYKKNTESRNKLTCHHWSTTMTRKSGSYLGFLENFWWKEWTWNWMKNWHCKRLFAAVEKKLTKPNHSAYSSCMANAISSSRNITTATTNLERAPFLPAASTVETLQRCHIHSPALCPEIASTTTVQLIHLQHSSHTFSTQAPQNSTDTLLLLSLWVNTITENDLQLTCLKKSRSAVINRSKQAVYLQW